MNFGQGHGLAVLVGLSFPTQHFNQVQSHFLIYTTLIYPAIGYHVLVLGHPSCENLMPLHNTLPLSNVAIIHNSFCQGYPIFGNLLVQKSLGQLHAIQ